MTRVTENSNIHALNFSLGKTKKKLEDLQLKGSTLKSIRKPSDNPINNVESMTLGTTKSNSKQFIKNIGHAMLQLTTTEQAIESIGEILAKAKEIAISQSSDIYNDDVRANVAQEVRQLRNQTLAIANQRIGHRFLFSGHKTLEKPFDENGHYHGDDGQMNVEIAKDYFVPINLHGVEVFYSADKYNDYRPHPLLAFKDQLPGQFNTLNGDPLQGPSRSIASIQGDGIKTHSGEVQNTQFHQRENIFSLLDTLQISLENNDADTVQTLLEKIDDAASRLITLRTRIGSLTNTLQTTQENLEKEFITIEERNSQLTDADIAELFSDLTKQQDILKTTYKAGASMMNSRLLDFLK